jgi:HEAT repeat protein
MGHNPSGISLAARFAAYMPPLSREAVEELERALTASSDGRVRGAALGALVRAGGRRGRAAWPVSVRDPDPAVRRRGAELAPSVVPVPVVGLLTLLTDSDAFVAETAAWALGEATWTGTTRARVLRALIEAAGAHPDPLVRESAVAALGAVGDPRGLPAILAACSDRPPIRRRAVLALAPFDGPEVDAALERALADSDWQVRQAAEDLR